MVLKTSIPQNPKSFILANPGRFKTIQDLTQMRPDCGAAIDDILMIDNELMVIMDLNSIGNLLSSYNNPAAGYIRTHGVMVQSYVSHRPCSVFCSDLFILLALSGHIRNNPDYYFKAGKLAGSIPCISGAFLFLSVNNDVPDSLNMLVEKALTKKAGVIIKLQNGTYRVFYEQFPVPDGLKKEQYQNIVIQKQ